MRTSKTIKIIAAVVVIAAMKIQISVAADTIILAFGDSLTAGYGLAPEHGFSHQLEQQLINKGHMVTVINGGVSGDTTSGGLARLEWVLASAKPDLVILELGANDALRGISPKLTRSNIKEILSILERAKINTLVAGMIAPPNMGDDYGLAFNRIFPELAKEYNDSLYPFFLEGVAGNPKLNQSDAMRPNAAGVTIIVKKIIPHILKSLKKSPSSQK